MLDSRGTYVPPPARFALLVMPLHIMVCMDVLRVRLPSYRQRAYGHAHVDSHGARVPHGESMRVDQRRRSVFSGWRAAQRSARCDSLGLAEREEASGTREEVPFHDKSPDRRSRSHASMPPSRASRRMREPAWPRGGRAPRAYAPVASRPATSLRRPGEAEAPLAAAVPTLSVDRARDT